MIAAKNNKITSSAKKSKVKKHVIENIGEKLTNFIESKSSTKNKEPSNLDDGVEF